MKRISLFLVLALLAIAMIGTTAVALAHNGVGQPGEGRPGPGGRGIGGEVTAIDGDTITVESPRGTATIVTTDDTIFTVNGETGSLDDISLGMFAGARGEMSDDGSSVTATHVMASDDAPQRPDGPGGRGIGGEVTAIDGDTITVENPCGTATIITSGDTTFTVNGEAGSLDDISLGMFVGARGEVSDDGGSITATHVMASDDAPQRPDGGKGRPGAPPSRNQ